MPYTIEDRLYLLLREQGGREDQDDSEESLGQFARKGFWSMLSAHSTVTSGRWRNFFSGQQKAAPDMIEAAAKLWPQYAFWLATGITDGCNGHVAPTTAVTFPERFYGEDDLSSSYFRQSISLNTELLSQVPDTQNRGSPMMRRLINGVRMGGAAIDRAYEISSSSSYLDLMELSNARLKELPGHWKKIKGAESDDRPWLANSVRMKETIERRKRWRDPRTSHQDDWDLFYTEES